MFGEGAVNHSLQQSIQCKIIDMERTEQNIDYCNKNIRDVYHDRIQLKTKLTPLAQRCQFVP